MNFLLALLLLLFASPVEGKDSSCNYFTEKYTKKFNLPNKLLTSISLVESGVKRGDNYISWPWSLNIGGKSKYFEDKLATIKFIKNSKKSKNNFDLGCMQINFKYHGKNFKSISDILDPDKNVEYAAKFLRSLYTRHRSWNEAISRYHSSEPTRKKIYLKKVKYFWVKLRQKHIKISNNKTELEQRKIDFFKNQLSKEKKLYEG